MKKNIINKIIIIGTTPPCPRCKLLTEIVTTNTQLIDQNIDIRHISYTSKEAVEIAASLDLFPGTATDVAKLIGKEMFLI